MADEKRYYWLKLKEDFFSSKRIKKLRGMAGGDTYMIIYLKMQLLALKTEGILTWTGLEDSFADELALDLNENPDDVAVTLMYLLNTKLAEMQGDTNIFLPWVVENTGSETSAAERMRKMRERNNVTPMLQCCYGEIEKDKREKKQSKSKKEFTPPTVEEVREYVKEKGYNIDADYFWSYYNASDWIDKNNEPVLNWKLKLVTWAKKEEEKPKKRQYTTAAEYKAPTKIDVAALESIRRDFKLEK